MVAAPRSPLSHAGARRAERGRVRGAVPGGRRQLHLTAGTVRNYISAILRKTGARNRLEAVRVAEAAGWFQ